MADSPETSSDNVYEMLWDCEFCGTKKLLGKTQRFCPSCGAPQNPEQRYFPADEDKVAVKDHRFVGVDKICASCGNLNGAASQFCGRCGAPLEGVEGVKTLGERERAAGEAFEEEDLNARLYQERDAAVGRVMPQAEKKQSTMPKWLPVAGVVVLVAIIGFVLFALFATRTETVSAVGFRWEREVSIEELKAESGRREGSCSMAPAGAYNLSERWEQVDTRRVPDGEECRTVQIDQGDGTFREERRCETRYRDEAVMGDVCYYTINRWSYERSVTADGDRDDTRIWPEVRLAGSGCSQLGCERESGREERFYLVLSRDSDETFECSVPLSTWENTPQDARFTVEFGVVGGGARCNSLEPAS